MNAQGRPSPISTFCSLFPCMGVEQAAGSAASVVAGRVPAEVDLPSPWPTAIVQGGVHGKQHVNFRVPWTWNSGLALTLAIFLCVSAFVCIKCV